MRVTAAFLSLALLLGPAAGLAADDVPPACGGPFDPEMFEPIEPRPLTRNERRDLERLFDRLADTWRGTMEEEVCMASGESRRHGHASELRLRDTRTGLTMEGQDKRLDTGTIKNHKRSLFITADGLRVDTASRAGEVELLELSDEGLAYLRRYRVVYKQGKPVQPEQPAEGQATRHPWFKPGKTQDDDDDLGIVAPAKAEQPKRRASVQREERFSIALDGNSLVLTEVFRVQGVYSGSKTWRLRR